MKPITIDPEKCNRDGICVKACPTAVIELTSSDELPTPVKDFKEYCLACGHCVAVCPTGAFSLDWLKTGQCAAISKELVLHREAAEQFLRSRRSIRNFKDKPVEREKLEKLLEIACFAPSAKNNQLWHWTVVENPDDVKKSFKSNTKLVIVNHASNVIGTIQPIKEIGRLCKENGIIFAIDASQSAGKIPVDMEEHNLDIIAFTGHKSLLGPTGIGGLYVREGIEIKHTRAGGTGVRSAVRTHLNEYPYRLEYGTPNTLGIAGLLAGYHWVERKGLEHIHQHETKLTTKLRDGLQKIDGVTLYCQDDLYNHISILLFNIDGLEAMNTGTLLDVDYNIACRTGLHCAPLIHHYIGTAPKGSIRFSISRFTTEEETDYTKTKPDPTQVSASTGTSARRQNAGPNS